MSCPSRVVLIETALGPAPTADLARHFAECARCRAELQRQRGLLARIDGEIQAGLQLAASPACLARAARQAAQRPPAAWRLSGWVLPVAAAVGVLALSGLALRRGAVEPLRQSSRALPDPAQPSPPAREEARPRPSPAPAVVPARRRAPASEPEVFLRAGDQAVIQRFAEAMRREPARPLSLSALLAPRPLLAGSAEDTLAPIAIPPLRFESARLESGSILPLTSGASDADIPQQKE